jgi:uncharacterized protein (TIGR02678 family)
MTAREQEDRAERTAAIRALLTHPFLDATEPEYALVRRHEREIARTLQATYGYQLEVGSTAARASGPPTEQGLHRSIRVPPASVSGRRRPPDDWPVLSDRACLILLLTLVALERSGAQTAIAELARGTERAGADVDPPVAVDFKERRERVAFADGLDLLCEWGILAHTAGSHESYARRTQDDDEALFTIDHRRLALLLRDPALALNAARLDDLAGEADRYAPTIEGENRARAESLARRLTEDPVVLLSDLSEEERTYFLGQRARIEDAVGMTTGYAIERRREGSALISDDREFTDIPFPTNATIKQLALLLCDTLTQAGPDGLLTKEALRGRVRTLMTEHRRHWDRDPSDHAQVTTVTDAAIQILAAADLARRTPSGAIQPTPLAARFRSPSLRTSSRRDDDS